MSKSRTLDKTQMVQPIKMVQPISTSRGLAPRHSTRNLIRASVGCLLAFTLLAGAFQLAVVSGGSSRKTIIDYKPTIYSQQQSPQYVRKIGEAAITQQLQAGEVVYSKLDEQGRTQQVRACINYEMMQRGKIRAREIMPDPSGWPRHNPRVIIRLYNGRAYQGSMWNRSHLLAKSLGGQERLENLITGTRMQNVGANDGQGGMAFHETKIRDWLAAHPNGTVQFVATPAYYKDEQIPRSVFVQAQSSDKSINESLEVYNTAAGFSIDYQTGDVGIA